jgi:hypothetical protein
MLIKAVGCAGFCLLSYATITMFTSAPQITFIGGIITICAYMLIEQSF